jgi:predicted Zn-dependent protease
MKNWIFKSLFFLALVALVSTCSRNPVTGKKQLSFMSEEKEIALGKQSDPSVVASFGLYENPKIQSFINRKGQQMARISHRPNLTYEFKVLDSPVVNAFALPGGYVYFTRGILAHFNNEAEFAGVLGHEIGHVTARHGARQQTQQILAQAGLIAGTIFSQQLGIDPTQASQGVQLLMLSNSRAHESESDELGVEYSTQIGYDAHYMADFFNTLSRMQGNSAQALPEFLSTHPNPDNRNARVKQLATKEQAKQNKTNLKVNRDSYLKLIDGLTYGEDPQQGYVENNVFYHPGLKFQYKYPNNWRLVNSPMQVQMANADGSAGAIFRLAEGSNLNTIKQEIITNYKLNVIQEKQESVNGMNALAFIGDITQENGSKIRLMTYLISYAGNTYLFHGIASATDFSKYSSTFQTLFESFDKLTDPSKLNKQAEKIKIVTVKSNGTLRQALTAAGAPSARLEEFSLINGMKLTDPVKSGMLIKVVQ